MILAYEPECVCNYIDIYPISKVINWLGPFTKAKEVKHPSRRPQWANLLHVPALILWLNEDIDNFYALFYERLTRKLRNEKIF